MIHKNVMINRRGAHCDLGAPAACSPQCPSILPGPLLSLVGSVDVLSSPIRGCQFTRWIPNSALSLVIALSRGHIAVCALVWGEAAGGGAVRSRDREQGPDIYPPSQVSSVLLCRSLSFSLGPSFPLILLHPGADLIHAP